MLFLSNWFFLGFIYKIEIVAVRYDVRKNK
jgi:hypothetical protein